MRSMTGYGRATAPLGSLTLTVQVSSVNRKTLDLTVSLPEAWEIFEPLVNEQVRKFASRGKVHVDFELSGTDGSDLPAWDEAAASAMLDRLAAFAAKRGIPFQPTPEVLWSIANVQRKTTLVPAADAAQPTVLTALVGALTSFGEMRAKEGAALLADLTRRLATLQQHVAVIRGRAPQVTSGYREQLHRRLRDAGLELDIEDERVLREIALFADRCDVSEELTRLHSHLEQFGALLRSDAEIGRKAEFILQEIGREVNTIGSKANDLEISRNVIELKNELERIREQIANVE